MLLRNVPARHDRHSALELTPLVDWYVPAEQAWQVDSMVCPEACKYLPVPHAMHTLTLELPVVFPYVPAGHATQDG